MFIPKCSSGTFEVAQQVAVVVRLVVEHLSWAVPGTAKANTMAFHTVRMDIMPEI